MRLQLLSIIVFVFLVSCQSNTPKSRGAIVLGDSSAIITESDPQYLSDYVQEDIKPRIVPTTPEPATTDSATATNTSTVATLPENVPEKHTDNQSQQSHANVSPTIAGKGLKIEFKELTVFIPGIETISFRNQNTKNLNGVSYQMNSGNLQGNKLVMKGARITRVQQRYITTIVATKDGKDMELDDLDESVPWGIIKGNNGVYPIKGLSKTELKYKDATAGAIRTAISRAARGNRNSRNEIREWETLARRVKSVNRPPVRGVLQSVMWRIDGSDSKGKTFTKNIRLDMPI